VCTTRIFRIWTEERIIAVDPCAQPGYRESNHWKAAASGIITPGEPMPAQVTIPLTLEPQPEGGYAVRSPALPALITEGDTEAEAIENAWDALLALLDAYDQLGWPLPLGLPPAPERETVHFEQLRAA
jgi:antitoxin HicB